MISDARGARSVFVNEVCFAFTAARLDTGKQYTGVLLAPYSMERPTPGANETDPSVCKILVFSGASRLPLTFGSFTRPGASLAHTRSETRGGSKARTLHIRKRI